MATPLLLSDTQVVSAKSMFADLFADQNAYKTQLDITKRVTGAINAIGGLSAAVRPAVQSQIDYVLFLDDITAGSYDLLNSLYLNSATYTATGGGKIYAEMLDETWTPWKSYPNLASCQMRLYDAQPSAVLYSLFNKNLITTTLDSTTKTKVCNTLNLAADRGFKFGKDSIETLIADNAYKANVDTDASKTALRKLARLCVLVRLPQDLKFLWSSSYEAALQIAHTPRDSFVTQLVTLGMSNESATAVHDYAVMVDMRNEQAWTAMLASKSQWSPATMSSSGQSSGQPAGSYAVTGTSNMLVNYANIFRESYNTYCDDCSSVTGPAAYFVDLLRMLKNCPSNPQNATSASLLSKLLERRPDLKNLKLTCSNVNTLIPYIDLVNETLESYIVNILSPASMPAFDMTDQDTSKVNIAQPQQTQFTVYKRNFSKTFMFPLHIFPYNQAVDAMRCYLTSLNSSVFEIMSLFASKYRLKNDAGKSGPQAYQQSEAVIRYALAAECLNLLPEDFVAITSGSVFGLSYFTGTGEPSLTLANYQTRINYVATPYLWGYNAGTLVSMQQDNDGLTNVRNGFLPRANLNFEQFLALLKTRFLGGRLAIVNSNNAPIFNTDISDWWLYHPTSTNAKASPTMQDYTALSSFIRLWRKTSWSMSDLDLALTALGDQGGSADNPPLVTAETIAALADIQRIQTLTGIPIKQLMPLWYLMDSYDDNSLYATLFLQGNLSKVDSVWGQDQTKRVLTNTAAKISDNRDALLAAFQISGDHFSSILQGANVLNNVLNLANISGIYRVSLFCRMVGISPYEYSGFIRMGPQGFTPFKSPRVMYETLVQWQICVDAGITLRQALFITGVDEKLGLTNQGYGVDNQKMVDTVASIVAGLMTLEQGLPLGTSITTAMATATEVSRIANLMFDPTIASQVTEFVEGSSTTSQTQTSLTYQNILLPYFRGKESDAQTTYFGQAAPTGTPEDIAIALENQLFNRRLFFLRAVTPAVKTRLTGELIISKISALLPDCDPALLRLLLTNIITTGTGSRTQAAMQTLTELLSTNQSQSDASSTALYYFRPPISDVYKFQVPGSTKPNFTVDGASVNLEQSGANWVSPEIRLNNGQTYVLRVSGGIPSGASFSTPRFVNASFSSDVLLQSKTITNARAVLNPTLRTYEFVQAFKLSALDVQFLQEQLSGSSLAVNFNAITYEDIKKLARWTALQQRFQSSPLSLFDFYRWINSQDRGSVLAEKLAAFTGLAQPQVQEYLDARFSTFSVTDLTEAFRDDSEILKLCDATDWIARNNLPGLSSGLLCKWATPTQPWLTGAADAEYTYAAELRQIMRALPLKEDGNDPLTKASDTLRSNQRSALTAYILSIQDVKNKGILDEGNLFEYFLIDVQMGSGLQTTRMKQATSSVQLYVQRCILGLEKPLGVSAGTINLKLWDWMKRYRLWEANRKVFLYPENWLDPTLRDDKSEIFKDLEAKLLQTELDETSVTRLIQEYVYDSHQVADLDIVTYSLERRGDYDSTVHLFGRTRNAPYTHYYRLVDITSSTSMIWKPWSRIDVEVPAIESDQDGRPLATPGTYLAPEFKDKRLFLFIPQITLKHVTQQVSSTSSSKTFQQIGADVPKVAVPLRYWQIQMAWTEYRIGKWSPKQLSPATITTSSYIDQDAFLAGRSKVLDGYIPATVFTGDRYAKAAEFPPIGSLRFWTYVRQTTIDGSDTSVMTVVVDRHIGPIDGKYNRLPLGAFELRGQQLLLCDPSAVDRSRATIFTETIPTVFNKLSHDIPSSGSSSLPVYKTTHDTSDLQKPRLSTAADASDTVYPRTMKFTMSFDLSNGATLCSGLFQDVVTNNSTLTYFTNSILAPGDTYTSASTDILQNIISPTLMSATSNYDTVDQIYSVLSSITQTKRQKQTFGVDPAKRHELSQPQALYNWELGAHSVMLIMERLLDTQQFDLGIRIARLVFDPSIDGTDLSRCWRFLPFREIAGQSITTIESLLKTFSATSGAESSMPSSILEWRKNPFTAHVVARSRPIAYMKRIVMKYIELLIASGDEYFRQNTLESIPWALQRYVEASHVLGPAPQVIPKLGRRAARSYSELETSFNDFSNAPFDLELDFPFYCDPSRRGGVVTSTSASYGLSGMLRTTYFCVPTNPKLMDLKLLIDDRFFKIRNCQDINGVTRVLSIYEPPLDVSTLTQAVSRGISVSALLNDSVGPMPNFRFASLLSTALDMCGELKNMGAAFLAVKESRDSEALAVLQAKQDSFLQEMSLTMKELARKEIEKSIDELHETRRGQVARLQYYLDLSGDTSKIPTSSEEWDDIAQSIEKPSTDGLGTTANERLQLSMFEENIRLSRGAVALDTIAAIIQAVPDITMNCEPLGVGTTIGGISTNAAASTAMTAGVLRGFGEIHAIEGEQAARKAELIGQYQERRMEANAAGRDVKVTDKQIATMQIRLAMCDEDIKLQRKYIANSAEMSEWLRNKYTSQELYQWMEGQIRTMFYQTYLMANDLAKKAQKAYRFERKLDAVEYVSPSYWNSGRDGLLSGENLYLALKRLEAAYNSQKGHDFEIQKTVSLRQLQPLALLALCETGTADFTLPETLFDYDFPGHYLRRIKTLSVSIVTSSDIARNVAATLKLLEHRYRIRGMAASAQDYVQKSGGDDDRFRTDQAPIAAIAVSQQTEDSGVFDYELEFNDYQRYVPFEGAGVISKWRIELPTAVKPFDYSLITDIVLNLKYTSLDGGVGFRKIASDAVKSFQNTVTGLAADQGLFGIVDVKTDFPTQWNTLSASTTVARSATLSGLQNLLPYWARGRTVKVESITALVQSTTATTWTSNLTLSGTSNVTWKAGNDLGSFKTVLQTGLSERFTDWTVGLTSAGASAGLKRLIFVVRYYLT